MALRPILRMLSAGVLASAVTLSALTGPALAQDEVLLDRLRNYAETYMDASLGGAVIDPMVSQLGPQFYPLNPGRQSDVDAAVYAAFERMFNGLAPQMVDQVVDFMWREMSEEDLEALLDFYESPTGARLLEITPALMADMMADMPAMMQETQALLIEAMTEEFAARDLDLGM